MRFDEIVQLIKLTYLSVGTVDVIAEETPREIFAEKKSIRQTEFYQAYTTALRPEATFLIWADEYDDEQRLNHNGTAYQIIRTYKTGRTMELVCTALDNLQTNLSKLRSTVEIWHNVFTENSMGENSPSTDRLCTVPALIEYKGGGAREGDGVIETMNNLTVTIRYREDITPDMFVKIEGVRHNIRFIEDPFNRHESLILHVERVLP